MLIDLVQTTTRDGVHLDGAFQAPAASSASVFPLDAVCFVHGTGGNFYQSTLFDSFAERFLPLGCAVLRINTRGHDVMSNAITAKGGRRLGAAYEQVDECRHDLAAWLDWLRQRTGPRIGLIGHSLGAVKCLYALAHEPRLAASCVVALSPPRLAYSWFCTSPEGPRFLETYASAEQHIQGGQPAALLDVKLPLPFVVTAAGYVEKYGPDERYNYLRLLLSVPCPALVTLGSIEVENNMAFRGAPEALAALGSRPGTLTVETIAGADHFYTGVRPNMLACVEGWLRTATNASADQPRL
jgi:pimeloyl-ACP methyl ester carboxylesterase